jgi:O-antigen/teichoic acid export membrane protein
MSMDTLILALFVPHSFIAQYGVAWNLASLFATFGGSISRTLFPEISKLNSENNSQDGIAGLLRVGLEYSGLFTIPGLVGAAILGDRVLLLYGQGFKTAYYVLLILTFARLLYGYMEQFVSTINAVDRPDLTLYINATFVAANIGLNVLLTWQFGWYGAAVATTVSASVGLMLAYYYASQIVTVTSPIGEIGKQFLSAGIMASVVLLGRLVFGSSLPLVIALVGMGAVVYFLSMLTISQEFRVIVIENTPLDIDAIISE